MKRGNVGSALWWGVGRSSTGAGFESSRCPVVWGQSPISPTPSPPPREAEWRRPQMASRGSWPPSEPAWQEPLPALPHSVPFSAVASSGAGPLEGGGREGVADSPPQKALQPWEAGIRNICPFPSEREVWPKGKA